jgi:hypothetical protein
MADTIPNEGRDYMLGIFPKNGTNAANLYLFLFKGGSATTTPAATATIGTMGGTFAEVTTTDYPGYARVAIPAADWGSPATETVWDVTSARVITAAQKSFAAATAAATPSAPINGFGIASATTAGVAVYYSNFDDTTGISSLALGDIIRVTPKYGIGG